MSDENVPNAANEDDPTVDTSIRHSKVKSVDEYDEDEENIHQGVKGGEARCSYIGFLHNKRMFYLRLEKTDEEIKEMTKEEQKDLLETIRLKISHAKAKGTIDKIAFTNLKNFEKNFGEPPSADNFEKVDTELEKRCKNIIDLYPFMPENPAEMGGHPGAFINIYVEDENKNTCSIWGGKKWISDSVTEYEFYQHLYKESETNKLFETFKKYIPEFRPDNKCKPSNPMLDKNKSALQKLNYYFPISNSLNNVRKDTEKVHMADFKLGYRTGFLHEKGNKSIPGAKKRDEFQSLSYQIGFRLEGSSLVTDINNISHKFPEESGWHESSKDATMYGHMIDPQKSYHGINPKPDQYQMYLLNPGFVFDTLFYNTPDNYIREFEKKLNTFENEFIKSNFEAYAGENTPAIAFIGCSILVVNGGNGIDFKLIDFAHPYVLATQTTKEFIGKPDTDRHKKTLSNNSSCCAVNNITGEVYKRQTSKNNKLGVEHDYKKKEAKKLMKGDDRLNFTWKINIDYPQWRHTFQNFMSGLLSFVYSFHFWANSRLNYKYLTARNKITLDLKEKFNSYNKYFDNKPPNKPDKNAKWANKYDPPYIWTRDQKEKKLNTLIDKSISNLSKMPN